MNLDFNQICRLCFKFCENFVDLRDVNGVKNLASDVIEKIQFCYCFKIDPSEPLPSKVCHQCIQVLMLFYVTKKNFEVSEQFLRNVLSARNSQESSSAEVNVKPKAKEVSVLLNKISVPNTVYLNQNTKDKFRAVKQTRDFKEESFAVENKSSFKGGCGKPKKLDAVQSRTDLSDVMVKLVDLQKLEVKLKGIKTGGLDKKPSKVDKLMKNGIDTKNILPPKVKKARKAKRD